MTPDTAMDLIDGAEGRFFVIQFVKRSDGSLREMVGRRDVAKHVTGAGLKFDPAKKNLCTLWDSQKQGYRMINLETVTYFKCGEVEAGVKGSCEYIGVPEVR